MKTKYNWSHFIEYHDAMMTFIIIFCYRTVRFFPINKDLTFLWYQNSILKTCNGKYQVKPGKLGKD